MSLSEQEYQEFLAMIDQSIAKFGGRPPTPGVDQNLYDELRRIREAMIRLRRDLEDPNVPPEAS